MFKGTHSHVVAYIKADSHYLTFYLQISYNSGRLASAGSDVAVGVWLPKNIVETLY